MRSNERTILATLLALGVGALLCGAPAPAHAQGASGAADAAMTDEARKLYDEAKRAKDKGDHPACVAKLRAAWALKKHRQVAGLLGECELRAGAKRDAAEHLAYFLDNAGDAPPAAVAAVRALYDEARAEIAVVAVKASADGADRKVDGRPLAPEETRVFLPAGEHVFSASKAGAGAGEKKVFVSAGQEREVVVELVAEAGSAAPPPVLPPYQAPSTPPTDKADGPSLIPGIVMGGVGVVGLAVGVGLLVTGSARGSDAEAIAQQIDARDGKCEPEVSAGFEQPCQSFFDVADEQDTLNLAGTISLIGGGLLLAGGVGWTVWAVTSEGDDATAATRSRHVTLTPSLGPEGGALRLHGAF